MTPISKSICLLLFWLMVSSASSKLPFVNEAIHPQEPSKKLYVCPPCGCSQDDEVFTEAGTCSLCKMAYVEKTDKLKTVDAIFTFTRINETFCTAGQPTLEQLESLKKEGFKTIINLRPPSEHQSEKEAAKAKELGFRYINIPVVYLAPKDENVDAFLRLTDEIKNEKVLIHCTAAVRVSAFWMIRRVLRDGLPFEKALEEAHKIGLRNRPHLIEFARKYIESHAKR
ncbi:MAG: protein tyrosine phosphatase family protein [Acidobacteriota bacterium]